MSTNMIRTSLAPSDRAASMYSFSLIDSVWPRTIRATAAQLKNAMMPIDRRRLGPTMETSAIATSRNGNDRTTSMKRARKLSSGSPEVAGRETDDDAEEDGDAARDHAHEERNPSAVGNANEHVPAEVVGAEEELRARPSGQSLRRQAGVEVLGLRPVPDQHRDDRSENRDQRDQHDRDGAGKRHPVAAKPCPRELPGAPPFDRARRGRKCELIELGEDLAHDRWSSGDEVRPSSSPASTG